MSFTNMTHAMFEIPFRMFEMPFLMSAAMLDSMLGNNWRANDRSTRHRGRQS